MQGEPEAGGGKTTGPPGRGELGAQNVHAAWEAIRSIAWGPLSRGGENSKLGTKLSPK